MLLIVIILILLCLPYRFSFRLNCENIIIAGIKIPYRLLRNRNQKKSTHASKWGRLALKAVRLKRLQLQIGYQCAMIDDSMSVYEIGLMLLPGLSAFLNHIGVATSIQLQYFPVKNSEIRGMIEIWLVRIMIELIRRLKNESSHS